MRGSIGDALEEKFAFLFDQLNVPGTRAVVDRHCKAKPVARSGKRVGAFVPRRRSRGLKETAMPNTMMAVVKTGRGPGRDATQIREVPVPRARAGEAL